MEGGTPSGTSCPLRRAALEPIQGTTTSKIATSSSATSKFWTHNIVDLDWPDAGFPVPAIRTQPT
eukprot:3248644-Pyramimonas_sp.AAC.1